MCGIAGIAGRDVGRLESTVRKMTDCISHRGPDGDAAAVFENCILGHRRLSIVDLKTGDQPMTSPDGATIIFNGEFYGFLDIRKKLNYNWKTTSDTEVILALYHQHGATALPKHMRGMFAYAIWDEQKQLLTGARDRFGEKPYYYALTEDNQLVFASEIKSILSSGLIRAELNNESLTHYLKHLYVHPYHTIYKNIHVIPPGHCYTFSDGKMEITKYWDLPRQQIDMSFEDAKDECYRLLEKAVKEQLVADVPVGCFLSGGLDSSTITAFAAKNSTQQLSTISFSFGEEKSELSFSRQVADKYNTNNIELHEDDFDISSWFVKMNDVYDEPFADSSAIPTFLISQLASKKFKVVLTGDGGDELFAGYSNWYRSLFRIQQPENFTEQMKNAFRKLRHSKYRSASMAEIHLKQNIYFSDSDLRSLCKFQAGYQFNKFLEQPYNTVDAAMRMDLKDYMPGDILVKTDRAAMANSLELRAPFLDVDFAEFCISLPEKFKINQREDKIIMREAFSQLWPDSIKGRQKQGFGAPVHEWLLQKKMKELKKEMLGNKNSKIFGYIDYDKAGRYIANDNYQTWILLTLALWMEKHL